MNLWLRKNRGKIKCICIDAGHGGFANKEGDPGAVRCPYSGKSPHLRLLKLGKTISGTLSGYSGWCMPVRKNVPVELNKRGKILNDCKADLCFYSYQLL